MSAAQSDSQRTRPPGPPPCLVREMRGQQTSAVSRWAPPPQRPPPAPRTRQPASQPPRATAQPAPDVQASQQPVRPGQTAEPRALPVRDPAVARPDRHVDASRVADRDVSAVMAAQAGTGPGLSRLQPIPPGTGRPPRGLEPIDPSAPRPPGLISQPIPPSGHPDIHPSRQAPSPARPTGRATRQILDPVIPVVSQSQSSQNHVSSSQNQLPQVQHSRNTSAQTNTTPQTTALTPLEREFSRRHAEMQSRARLLLAELQALHNPPTSPSPSTSSPQSDTDEAITSLESLLSGKLTSVVCRPPPRAVRAVAREVARLVLEEFNMSGALDMVISDLESVRKWAGSSTTVGHDDDAAQMKRVLDERVVLLEAALPARISFLARDGMMHFEHEYGFHTGTSGAGGGYVNSLTSKGIPVADIPRARFIRTADGFAFDIRELVATGGTKNPVTGRELSAEDVTRVREHALAGGLHVSPDESMNLAGEGSNLNGGYADASVSRGNGVDVNGDGDRVMGATRDGGYEEILKRSGPSIHTERGEEVGIDGENVFSDEAAIDTDFLGPVWKGKPGGDIDFARTRAESVSSMEDDREAPDEFVKLAAELEVPVRDQNTTESGPRYDREDQHNIRGGQHHVREDADPAASPIRPVWHAPGPLLGERQLLLDAPGAFPALGGEGEDEDWWRDSGT